MTFSKVLLALDSCRAAWFPLIIWGVLVLFVLALLLALEDGLKRLAKLHRVPCNHCRYHTGNPYLRCPVRPMEAFSESALTCGDYEPTPSPPPWRVWDTLRQRFKGDRPHPQYQPAHRR
ncbi:MAG: hypothetical protein O3C67_04330 [Cyanobacteria bacterium]|nr:hypothetical protein [Cyanobacteriota bacterium]MEB3268423.1 hypothetical protein [Leptolyngbya sp.]